MSDMQNTYPKIDTLFQRDAKHQVTGELRRPVLGTISRWRVTEKVDGTNIRIHIYRAEAGVSAQIGGRTHNAQIPAPLVEHLRGLDIEAARDIMDEHGLDAMTLFGEGYGPKIQGGGDYRDDQGFILFDVQVSGLWLSDDNVTEIAKRMSIPRVPILGEWSLDEIVERVRAGIASECSLHPRMAEGVVARTIEPLYDQRGQRLIIKVKTRDFG